MNLVARSRSLILSALVAVAVVIVALSVWDWTGEDKPTIQPGIEVLRFLEAARAQADDPAPAQRFAWLERHAQALSVMAGTAGRAAEVSDPAPLEAFRNAELTRLLPLLADPALKEARPPLRLREALQAMIAFADDPGASADRLPSAPPPRTLPTPGVIEATLIQAWMAVGADRFDLAAPLFESQLDTGPGGAPARLGLAFLALAEGEPKAAMSRLESATGSLISADDWSVLSLSGLRAQHHRLVAQTVLSRGIQDPAIVHLEQAITLAQEAHSFAFLHRDHWLLALLYRRQGAAADAARHAFRAFVYAKTMRNTWAVGERYDHLNRAMLLSGDPEQSVKAQRELLNLANRQDDAAGQFAQAGTLALAYRQADRSDDAVQTLRTALADSPATDAPLTSARPAPLAIARAQATTLLGWLLLDSGRTDEAWQVLAARDEHGLGDPSSAAATADPVSATMRLTLRAQVAEALGSDDDACRAWTEAIAVLRVPGLPDRVVFGLEKAVLALSRTAACSE